jgi:hypothetical protein
MNQSKTQRILLWLATAFIGILVVLFFISFFLDPIVRAKVERTMNAKLIGYKTRVAHAHLQLVNGALTLKDVTVIQEAHAEPPVGNIPFLKIAIQWRELLTGNVVADLLIVNPRLHIDLTQLRTESAAKVPFSKKGWQDAIQSIYPFKINRFGIRRGSIVYIDTDPNRPLKIDDLYFTAENIRNTRSIGEKNPSPVEAEAIVFDVGRASIKGRANFLAKPFATVAGTYHLANVPLSRFEPELQRVNLKVEGATLTSDGFVDYGPKSTAIEVYDARIAGGRFDYTHTSATAGAEDRRLKTVKVEAQLANNAPETLLTVDRLNIVSSEAAYTDESKEPHYRLFISDLWVQVTNLSNHFSKGPAHVALRGRFMGSGDTTIKGDFRPEKPGADFDIDLAVSNTNLPALNNLLRAYGRFDVKAGQVSVYSEMKVRRGNVTGYVKPLFSNVEVYNAQKDKNKPILHQAYELAIGAAAKLVKNSSTQKVATEVKISGNLNNPEISTWQAVLQFVENGFIQAILPGFDRQMKQSAAS